MGRPKGSLNKRKENNLRVISLNKNIPNTAYIDDRSGLKWVNWGKNNLYPIGLLDLYFNSVIHHSCVDFLVNSILGDGVDYESMGMLESDLYPNMNESWDEFIRKTSYDLVLFGGFSFQVIRNKDGRSYSYYHQPLSTVRLGKKDENGDIKSAYISKDWSNVTSYKPIEIEMLGYGDEIKNGKPYLMAYMKYNLYDEYYCYPDYIGAVDAIKSEIKLKQFDYNSIINNFTPSGILTMNQVSSDDERKMILDNIDAMFSDVDNANNIIVTFKQNNEDTPCSFQAITSNVEGVNLFSDNDERNVNRIISAHKIANKALIGMPMDSSGFSNEGTLLEAAYNLTNKITINNLRNIIVKNINYLLKMNGIEQSIILKPISFNIQAVDKVVDVDKNVNDTIV